MPDHAATLTETANRCEIHPCKALRSTTQLQCSLPGFEPERSTLPQRAPSTKEGEIFAKALQFKGARCGNCAAQGLSQGVSAMTTIANNSPNPELGWSPTSGRRTSGTSWPSLGPRTLPTSPPLFQGKSRFKNKPGNAPGSPRHPSARHGQPAYELAMDLDCEVQISNWVLRP